MVSNENKSASLNHVSLLKEFWEVQNLIIKFYIDPFNVCKHRKPRLGARAAWGQKNGAANRPAYCVKEKQTSLIDR